MTQMCVWWGGTELPALLLRAVQGRQTPAGVLHRDSKPHFRMRKLRLKQVPATKPEVVRSGKRGAPWGWVGCGLLVLGGERPWVMTRSSAGSEQL